ncbi:MAG: DUF4340 domain-containing protein [Desulfobacterales bacterium]|jgi:hypothetical protein|nr:DUF4340 domain-containing protein [Desulfobacterales bacterium]
MKLKKEFLILGVIIAALAVYLYQRSGDRTHYTLPTLPALAASDITQIQMTRGAETVVLVRRDGRWRIDPPGYPVDPRLAQEMLDTLSGLTLTALVSASGNFALYELDDAQKANVKAWQNDQLKREIDVGKAAPSFRHTFVRIAGDDRVYHGRDNFSFRFRTRIEDLRDKTVLAFDRQEIREIQIAQGETRLTLVRTTAPAEPPPAGQGTAEAWQTADGRPANGAAVEALLGTLASLQADGFIEGRDKAALGQPIYSVELKGPQEHSLTLFAPTGGDSKDHPAVSSGSDFPFSLLEDHAKRIMKNPEEFLKKEEKK